MRDKFAPPIELWDAKRCARFLGLRNAEAFKYQVRCGRLPKPVDFIGNAAQWDALQVREALREWR